MSHISKPSLVPGRRPQHKVWIPIDKNKNWITHPTFSTYQIAGRIPRTAQLYNKQLHSHGRLQGRTTSKTARVADYCCLRCVVSETWEDCNKDVHSVRLPTRNVPENCLSSTLCSCFHIASAKSCRNWQLHWKLRETPDPESTDKVQEVCRAMARTR